MPIKGQPLKLPRLGKIRLGTKAVTAQGVEYPTPSDHFIVKADDSTPEASAEAFKAVYGERPDELDILFPTEDVDQLASIFYRYYSRGGLLCRGDGVEAVARIDRTTGGFVDKDSRPENVILAEVSCSDDCPKRVEGRCRPVLCLQFLLHSVHGLGVWQCDTGGFHSIRNILSQVQLIKGLLGRISLVPLKLRLVPMTVQPPGIKKKTVRVLQLQAQVSLLELQERALQLPAPAVAIAALDDSEQPSDLEQQAEAFFEQQAEEEPFPEPAAQEAESTRGPEPGEGAVDSDSPIPGRVETREGAEVEALPLLDPIAGGAASAAAVPERRQFANIGEMLTVCLNELGIRAPEACEVLRIKSPPQFRGDLTAAYEKIVEYAQKKRG